MVADELGLVSIPSRVPASGSDTPLGGLVWDFSIPEVWEYHLRITSAHNLAFIYLQLFCLSFPLALHEPTSKADAASVRQPSSVRQRETRQNSRHYKRIRVIRTQDSLQPFRTAPVIHCSERNSLLSSHGLDVTSHREYCLRVRLRRKELPNCRRKPP